MPPPLAMPGLCHCHGRMSEAVRAEQVPPAHFCRKKVFRRWQAGRPQPGSADAILERQRQLAAAAREQCLQQREQARQDMLHRRQQVRSCFRRPWGASVAPAHMCVVGSNA